ncbi:MAG: hypothetical protein QXH40_01490 [Candidatus Bathyarchaeia archaeon]
MPEKTRKIKKVREKEAKKPLLNKKLLVISVTIAAVIILGAVLYQLLWRTQEGYVELPIKAAIIDQLSSSQLFNVSRWVNETFVENAKMLLLQRFPSVDYYSDNATVEQYSKLASLNYKMIIWRVHSALDPQKYIAICSSERYIPGKYEQYSLEQLKLCNITGDPLFYYAITPKFIEECMSGKFKDTVIILMSCNGLNSDYKQTAEALIRKGVKVFISWNGWIDKTDNDNAISRLLEYLIKENFTISEAVSRIPIYGMTKLDYYPHTSEVADYHIPNYKQSNVSGDMIFPPAIISRKVESLKL